MTIRVLLADDQALIRAGFKAMIDSAPDLTVVADAPTGAEAVTRARTSRADIVPPPAAANPAGCRFGSCDRLDVRYPSTGRCGRRTR